MKFLMISLLVKYLLIPFIKKTEKLEYSKKKKNNNDLLFLKFNKLI